MLQRCNSKLLLKNKKSGKKLIKEMILNKRLNYQKIKNLVEDVSTIKSSKRRKKLNKKSEEWGINLSPSDFLELLKDFLK